MRQAFITKKYKFLFSTSLIIILLCNASSIIHGQNWQWAEQFGTTQSETVDAMQTDIAGNIFLSGKFKDSFAWDATILQSIGKEDVYLTKLDVNGNVLWAKQGGSEASDESIDIVLDDASNVYCTGHYWFDADFDALHLQSSPGSRAIYLIKYDAEGNLLWGKSINGNMAKSASSLAIDSDGNVYLSGSFKGELFVGNTNLVASNQGDIFLAKFESTGELDWATQLKATVSIKSVTITVDKNDDLLLAGQFIGQINFNGDSFTNITGDNDVFILKYNTMGAPIWARHAGGVHEDDCSRICTDEFANIYLTGTFIGVMELSPETQIQTQGFNNNFYLLKYNKDGEVLWARSLGGIEADGAEDMIVNESLVVIAGYYIGEMSIDGIHVSGDEDLGDGFIIAFDLEGTARNIQTISSDGFVIPNNLNFTPEGEILSSGVFEQTAHFGNQSLSALGLFDIYLARIADNFTGIKTSNPWRHNLSSYPNPTTDKVYFLGDIKSYTYEIYDNKGALLKKGKNEISLKSFSKGIYFIRLQDQQKKYASFMIEKF